MENNSLDYKALFVLGLLGIVAYKIFKSDIQDTIEDKKEQKATEDTTMEKQQAELIHQAITGVGTDLKLLFETANQISNYSKVTKLYKDLFHSELNKDVQDDLNTSEFELYTNTVYKRYINKIPYTLRSTKLYYDLTLSKSVNINSLVWFEFAYIVGLEVIKTYTGTKYYYKIRFSSKSNKNNKYDYYINVNDIKFVDDYNSLPKCNGKFWLK